MRYYNNTYILYKTPKTFKGKNVYISEALLLRQKNKFSKTLHIFQVDTDCDWALRLNENSYKARLYRAKAHKELESDKFEEFRQELQDTFSQHEDLTKYFLNKKEDVYEEEEEEEDGQKAA